VVIRLFEGSYGWERRLLGLWMRRNRQRAQQLYGTLVQLKQDYTAHLAEMAFPPPESDPNQAAQAAASLALEIQKEHDRLDQEAPVQSLPRREALVKPTALGNAFVVLEEYPYERYGMDAMVYWPRLRPLVETEYGSQLTGYKMLLDMLLNIASLAIVFGLICLALALQAWAWLPLLATAIAWAIAYASYQGGVQIVLSMKEVIALCFDYYRHRLLKEFGLSVPADMQSEQLLWLQLGQFLRRGEGFYHPRWQAAGVSAAGCTVPGCGGADYVESGPDVVATADRCIQKGAAP
jgi:hypothetical protein